METVQNDIKAGLKDGLPIGLGYLATSFAFGILSNSLGLTLLEAVLISMTNLTSAGQLAAAPIIAAGGRLIELALTQLVINMRYSLMSISLSMQLDKNIGIRHRFILAFTERRDHHRGQNISRNRAKKRSERPSEIGEYKQ